MAGAGKLGKRVIFGQVINWTGVGNLTQFFWKYTPPPREKRVSISESMQTVWSG